MNAGQLPLFLLPAAQQCSPYRPNVNGHDPYADLVFDPVAFAETEADAGGPERARRCTCPNAITDGDRDLDSQVTCLFCGRSA